MCHSFGFKHSTRHPLRVLAPCAPFLGCYGHVWGWQPEAEQAGDTGGGLSHFNQLLFTSLVPFLCTTDLSNFSLFILFSFFSPLQLY